MVSCVGKVINGNSAPLLESDFLTHAGLSSSGGRISRARLLMSEGFFNAVKIDEIERELQRTHPSNQVASDGRTSGVRAGTETEDS